jgi:hypothetical protein
VLILLRPYVLGWLDLAAAADQGWHVHAGPNQR